MGPWHCCTWGGHIEWCRIFPAHGKRTSSIPAHLGMQEEKPRPGFPGRGFNFCASDSGAHIGPPHPTGFLLGCHNRTAVLIRQIDGRIGRTIRFLALHDGLFLLRTIVRSLHVRFPLTELAGIVRLAVHRDVVLVDPLRIRDQVRLGNRIKPGLPCAGMQHAPGTKAPCIFSVTV